jgi:protein tyrosine/serine phosphatase
MNKTILRGMSVMAFVLAFAAIPSFAQQYKELPNFQKVSERLFRGAQPAAGGVKMLAKLGVNTIINLRGENEQTRADRKQAEALGLRYYSLPMGGLSRPSDEQVERVLAIIKAPDSGTVFVHCKHGADRTGTVIACYRISQEGYTAETAQAEAKKYGMSWVQFGMKQYIGEYYRKRGLSERPSPGPAPVGTPNQKAVSGVDPRMVNPLSPLLN